MSRPKREGRYKYINVQIPEDVAILLDDYSNETRLPKNAIVEKALIFYLRKKASEKNNN